MVILILINVQYLQNAVFKFEKGLNHLNPSFSGSQHPLKNFPQQNCSFLPMPPCYLENPVKTSSTFLSSSPGKGKLPYTPSRQPFFINLFSPAERGRKLCVWFDKFEIQVKFREFAFFKLLFGQLWAIPEKTASLTQH